MRAIFSLSLVLLVACGPDTGQGAQQAAEPQPVAPVEPPSLTPIAWSVPAAFTNEEGKAASEISGGACAPAAADGTRLCIFVNDENRDAQLATIKDSVITPGAMIDLLGSTPALGREPAAADVKCPPRKKPAKEFDGEAVAYSAPYFYVAGSHGCSRKNFEFSTASFMLARINAADPQKITVDRTYRLSDVLRATDGVSAGFGQKLLPQANETVDPGAYNGLNIEGFAVADGRALIGLRAPAEPGKTYIVSTPVDDLFTAGNAASAAKGDLVTLVLSGETARLGIRDVVALDGGRVLALVGPAQEQPGIGYSIWLTDADPARPAHKLKDVTPSTVSGAKAEGMTLIENTASQARVLLLFDGEEYGPAMAPTELILDLN